MKIPTIETHKGECNQTTHKKVAIFIFNLHIFAGFISLAFNYKNFGLIFSHHLIHFKKAVFSLLSHSTDHNHFSTLKPGYAKINGATYDRHIQLLPWYLRRKTGCIRVSFGLVIINIRSSFSFRCNVPGLETLELKSSDCPVASRFMPCRPPSNIVAGEMIVNVT